MWRYIVYGALLFLAVYAIIQGIRCLAAKKKSKTRLAAYNAKTVSLSYGKMAYVDKGSGTAILSVHGIFGGFDQAYDSCRDFQPNCRIIAPSRFGYLGSDTLGAGTPCEQARAYAELLDSLRIDKAYVLGTSAGGSPAIRFALNYPERTAGLILYCSAMPLPKKLKQDAENAEYVGPPAFLCNDYAMFLLSPLFKPMMGMDASAIYSMLPVGERKAGILLDAAVTNPDMARNFEDYRIEELKCPVLVLHSKDDKLARYKNVTDVIHRFPNCTFVSFQDGGHLMAGHGEEVRKAVSGFMEKRNG